MTETNLYALNQFSKCNIAPENLEVSESKITVYKKHFLQEINATVCRVKFQSQQWHCGFEDDSSTHAHHAGITIDLTVTASQCRILANGGSMSLKDETREFSKGPKTTIVKQNDFDDKGADLSNKNRNECDSLEWLSHKTFEGHVQDFILNVRTMDVKVMKKGGLQI